MEKDNEMKGIGNSLDFGARIYDSRVGRWLSVDPLAKKYPGISPFAYVANNPILYIDIDGREMVISGSKEAQDAYTKMLHASTGNNYAIVNNKLTFIGVDANFTGAESETLINTIQSGIDSKDIYSITLVGDKSDDKKIFIDSYSEMKIDISDLTILGDASKELQGAVIGHFLNEIQVVGNFNKAHTESLDVEGKIYGELVGDNTITTRKDQTTEISKDYQTVIYEYNSTNKFEIKQGAKQNGYETIEIGGVPFDSPAYENTGELKSVIKVP